jgi:hypothetical protein
MLNLRKQWIMLFLLYFLSYLYCLPFAIAITHDHRWYYQQLNKVHQSCLIDCSNVVNPPTYETYKNWLNWKGKNYFIGCGSTNCLVTFWTLTHGMLYTGIGYFCPDLFWPSFSIGIAFEIFEKYQYECHDALDILFNTAGFELGRYLQKKY